MAFFQNRSINLLNVHYLITAVAFSGGGAFWFVYLLKSGLSVPAVLFTTAGIFALRLVLRLAVVPLGVRLGLRRLLMLGAALMAAMYVMLPFVDGVGYALAALVLTTSIADSIYWPAYHAYFAALGDAEHRGQQTGAREALAAGLGIVSPLAAGLLLVNLGPLAAFSATAAIQLISVIPLIWTPDVRIARDVPGAYRASITGVLLFVTDGWIGAGYSIVWQLALFISLERSYLAYGGALAFAALVGSVAGLLLGRLIDSGKGYAAVWLAFGALLFVATLRAVSLNHQVLAIAANALGALVNCIYVPTLMTAVYNSAKRSPCVLRFHVAAEGGWDVGVAAALCLCATIIGLGGSMTWAIATSILGAATGFIVLRRYYREHISETVDVTPEAGPGESQRVLASDAEVSAFSRQ